MTNRRIALVLLATVSTSTNSYAGLEKKRLINAVRPRLGVGGTSVMQSHPTQAQYSTKVSGAVSQGSTARSFSQKERSEAKYLEKPVTPEDTGDCPQYSPILIRGTAAAAALGAIGAATYYINRNTDDPEGTDTVASDLPADRNQIEDAKKIFQETGLMFIRGREKHELKQALSLISKNLRHYPVLYDSLADFISKASNPSLAIRKLVKFDVSHPKITEAVFSRIEKNPSESGFLRVETAFPYIWNASRSDSKILDRFIQAFEAQTQSTSINALGNKLSDHENINLLKRRGSIYTYFQNNVDITKLPKSDESLKTFAVKLGIPDLLVHSGDEFSSDDYIIALKNEINLNHYKEDAYDYNSGKVGSVDRDLFQSSMKLDKPSHIRKFLEAHTQNEAGLGELLQLARTTGFPAHYLNELVQSLNSLNPDKFSKKVRLQIAFIQINHSALQLEPKLAKHFPNESEPESVLLTFPEHKRALRGARIEAVKRTTNENTTIKTKIIDLLNQDSAADEKGLFRNLLLARPDSGGVVRQKIEMKLSSLFAGSQDKPALLSILKEGLKNRDLKTRYFALDLLKQLSPESVPPVHELEKMMDVYSAQERAGWKLSDPAHHNPKEYMYLVHGITYANEGHWVGRFLGNNAFEDPKAFVERELICTSLVTNEKNTTFRPTGVILGEGTDQKKGALIENIVVANGRDLSSNWRFFPRSEAVPSAKEIVNNTPLCDYNEIIINGTNRTSKKQIQIKGVFINREATPGEIREAYGVAEKLGVPVVDFRRSN
jgi:hypothetical protein